LNGLTPAALQGQFKITHSGHQIVILFNAQHANVSDGGSKPSTTPHQILNG
jgi:hypothetical protein